MKKLIVIAVFAILLTGCGVGTYSIQSGVEDAAYISFTDDIMTVVVDGQSFVVKTIKQKAYKSGRNIRQTVLNTIRTVPGQHEVKVMIDGYEVFGKKLLLSTGEHKILEL